MWPLLIGVLFLTNQLCRDPYFVRMNHKDVDVKMEFQRSPKGGEAVFVSPCVLVG